MKQFDVYKHPTQGFLTVKQGFAWPAFFFGAIWAFVKKMWGLGLLLLGISWLLSMIGEVFRQEGSEGGALVMLLALLAFKILIGMKGNDWRRAHLEKRGFDKLGAVQAATSDAAVAEAAKTSGDQQVAIA